MMKNESGDVDDDVCGICRDSITEATKIVECEHIFCFSCIGKWCNVSNSCPLCQTRFLKLCRLTEQHGNVTSVKPVDKREDNWMEVMEEYDSEECSIHTEDDDEEEEVDSAELGSEGDRYEEDFVVPDDVVIYEDGKIVDKRKRASAGPFGKPPKGQPDSTITTADGQIITISWFLSSSSSSSSSSSDDDEDDDGQLKEMSVDDHSVEHCDDDEDSDWVNEDDEDDEDEDDDENNKGSESGDDEEGEVLYDPRRRK